MKSRFGVKILAAVMMSAVAFSSVSTVAVPQSAVVYAAKKGFVKKSGKWYYYKNGRKVTGLNKISGKYYFFDKKGVMQSGKKTVSGFTYYFNKAKDGKAPALTDKSKKISGKTWYFSSLGRGFLSVGNKTGDEAVALLWDALGSKAFKNAKTDKDKLEVVYTYIDTSFKYLGRPSPDLSKNDWMYESALVLVKNGNGKCFHFAALTGLAAGALGFDAKIITGKGQRKGAASASEHAWVLIDGTYVLDTNYDNPVDGQVYFYKTYDEIKNELETEYTMEKEF